MAKDVLWKPLFRSRIVQKCICVASGSGGNSAKWETAREMWCIKLFVGLLCLYWLHVEFTRCKYVYSSGWLDKLVGNAPVVVRLSVQNGAGLIDICETELVSVHVDMVEITPTLASGHV